MGSFFFSPKGRMKVSRPVAIVMNSLNMLAPVLLLVALAFGLVSRFGGYSLDLNSLMTKYAVILVAIAISIRIIWGITIRIIQKRSKQQI